MDTLKHIFGIVVLVLSIASIAFYLNGDTEKPVVVSDNPYSATTTQSVATPEITFSVPSEFGLAVTADQVLSEGYIPPCDSEFDYCLYYKEQTYEGTNFESAGLRIEKRNDLTTRDMCLSTQPDGFTGLDAEIRVADSYATSKFGPVGDAGAGHSAAGDVYRLSFDNTCYEFEARIGTSQFQNYEPGTIRELTEMDRRNVQDLMIGILNTITFASGTPVKF